MIDELAARWRVEAGAYERDGAFVRADVLLRRVATELEAEARVQGDAPLTIEQAAKESGYSRDHLRALVASGSIANAGRRNAPRIRRADLPRKPARAS